MTFYALVVDVPAPVAVYDAIHGELLRRTGGTIDGLLVHVARATDDGFQVLEVWTDRAAFERADRDVVGPIVAEQAGPPDAGPADPGPPPSRPELQEFAVRGLVIPGTGTAI